jgi:hypothetical protein
LRALLAPHFLPRLAKNSEGKQLVWGVFRWPSKLHLEVSAPGRILALREVISVAKKGAAWREIRGVLTGTIQGFKSYRFPVKNPCLNLPQKQGESRAGSDPHRLQGDEAQGG